MLKDLSQGDVDYLKKHLTEARSFQEKEFKAKIDVELYKSYYCGDDYKKDNAIDQIYEEDEYINLNKIYPANNRVVPTLYYQNPKITFTARKNSTDFSAKILTAAVNYSYREMKIKKENQMAILDAWYAGFGCTKIGYQASFAYKQAKPKGMLGKLKDAVMGQQPDKEERIIDYIEYEGPFVNRINPVNVFRDPKQPSGKDRLLWIRYPKTLEDIITSDVYEYDNNFITRFRGKDSREVELEIYEGWLLTRKGLFIIALCEGYRDPIRYEQSSWKGDNLPFSFISFAEINDMHYPVSPMKVTSKQQRHVNYLTTLQFNVINKFRNQTGINENALSEEGKLAIKTNAIGGIVGFKTPVNGNIAPLVSAPIPADLFNVGQLMTENLQECLQVAGLRSGNSQNEPTLGQDQLKDFGNSLGTSGMQDKVREFVIDQATKLSQMIKQYATAPSLVPIVGMDLTDPQTGKLITQQWLEFGTAENPITLKQTVAGDYDCEVDIKSAQKPDDAAKLKLYNEMSANILQNPLIPQGLSEQHKKIDMAKFVQGWFNAYKEYVPEVNSFITDMTQEEIEAMKVAKIKTQAVQEQATTDAIENADLEKQKQRLDIEKGLQDMDMKDLQLVAGGEGGESESQVQTY